MAAKYWYVASNGNADWSVAGNWYLGSGGTGGAAGLPTASDTVYLNAASGSGTLTIGSGTTALCNGLICTGFTGTLAGSTALTITDTTNATAFLLVFSASMSITYTGTLTIGGSGSPTDIYFNGKTFPGNITLSKSAGTGSTYYYLKDTIRITGLLTISSAFAFIYTGELYTGQFSMSGTGSSTNRDISGGTIYLTGSGAVLTVSTTGSFSNNLSYVLTDASANTKTIVSTVSTASGFEPNITISSTGSGSYSLTGNFAFINVNNSGGATFSFGTSSLYTLNFNNSYVNWNNSAVTVTISQDILKLSPNMTVTATPAITMNANITVTSNGKQFTGAISVAVGSTLYAIDTFRLANALTLTNGSLSADSDVYLNSISSSSSNFRDITIVGTLYLTGTGTLTTTTTTTNLTVSIPTIYVQDTSNTGLAKTLTFNTVFGSPIVYVAGTGAGLITLTLASTKKPDVYVTNTGGSISFPNGTINSLTFVPGTTCTWANSGGQTLTIVKNLIFTSSQTQPTLTPTIIIQDATDVTLAGKSLVTGAITIGSSGDVNINGDFSSNSAITFTTSTNTYCTGNVTCTTLTLSNAANVYFQKNVTATATTATISGTAKAIIGYVSPGVYYASAFNVVQLTVTSTSNQALYLQSGTVTCTSGITVTNGGTVIIGIGSNTSTTLTSPSINLSTNSILKSIYSTINVSGAFTTAAGSIEFNNTTATFLTFGLSGVTSNYTVNNSKIYITGASTTAFSLAATIASYTSSYAIIEFNNTSAANTTFAGGGFTYYELIFNRGSSSGFNNVITGNNTFTNFRDWGTAAHFIIFPSGGTTTVGHFDVRGSSGNVVSLARSGTTATLLVKSPAGLVICDWISVTNVPVNETNTWYAGPNSTVTTSANWIAGGKVRNQSALGVG